MILYHVNVVKVKNRWFALLAAVRGISLILIPFIPMLLLSRIPVAVIIRAVTIIKPLVVQGKNVQGAMVQERGWIKSSMHLTIQEKIMMNIAVNAVA
jgi:hypothetical protein